MADRQRSRGSAPPTRRRPCRVAPHESTSRRARRDRRVAPSVPKSDGNRPPPSRCPARKCGSATSRPLRSYRRKCPTSASGDSETRTPRSPERSATDRSQPFARQVRRLRDLLRPGASDQPARGAAFDVGLELERPKTVPGRFGENDFRHLYRLPARHIRSASFRHYEASCS